MHPVEKEFVYSVGGMNEEATDALGRPRSIQGYAIFETYAHAIAKDKGASLSLDEMEQVARALVNMTAEKHPAVGKDKQVAVLESGRVIRVEQPFFLAPKQPFALTVFDNMTFSGPKPMVLRGVRVNFYNSATFIGTESSSPLREPQIELDGNVFVNCSFRNVVLWYNGGDVYLDRTNTAVNSQLAFGPGAAKRPDREHSLTEIFSEIQKP